VNDDALVTTIMTSEVVTVGPDTTVTQAARLMVQHGISSLPVVHDGKLVGILTETDVISREIQVDAPSYVTFLDAVIRWPWDHSDDEMRRVTAITVEQLMSHPVLSLTHDATIRDAATLLFERKFTSAPVVDSAEQLIGIVSQADIVRLIAEVGNEDGEPG
jgi:CBS domain-containing protein